jgi:hypothetical protein
MERFVTSTEEGLIRKKTPYIIDRLCACGNHPAEVFIPGFTNVAYPARRDAQRRLE